MKKWNIGWGTVSSCNMNCQFCYSKRNRKNNCSLEYDDWIRFVDENQDRINTINYGTGENTLSMDWFRLVNHIRKKYPNIRQALTTNGYLSRAVSDTFCMQAFIEAIDEVDVSLDYCDSVRHNEFRGQPDAYNSAIDTLDLCKKYEKSATIVFLGSQRNLEEENIDGLFAIAKEYNAILRMNMYRPTEGVNNRSVRFIVDYDTFVNTILYIAKKYHIISINDVLFSTILTGETSADPSGDMSIRILADGSITPSTYLIEKEYIIGNIKEKNILFKLENEKRVNNVVSRNIPEECSECVYRETCAGGVLDRRYLWYGNLEHKDPYCPQVYRRAAEKVLSLEKIAFCSVHDGYLPTIFFKP